MDGPIEWLDLPVRTYNRVKSSYCTIEQIKQVTDSDLLSIPGFGKGMLQDVKAALDAWQARQDLEKSNETYCINVNKMIAKLAIAGYIATVKTSTGVTGKLTHVRALPNNLYFTIRAMDAQVVADGVGLDFAGQVTEILRLHDGQDDEAKRIHDAVYEQYCVHG